MTKAERKIPKVDIEEVERFVAGSKGVIEFSRIPANHALEFHLLGMGEELGEVWWGDGKEVVWDESCTRQLEQDWQTAFASIRDEFTDVKVYRVLWHKHQAVQEYQGDGVFGLFGQLMSEATERKRGRKSVLMWSYSTNDLNKMETELRGRLRDVTSNNGHRLIMLMQVRFLQGWIGEETQNWVKTRNPKKACEVMSDMLSKPSIGTEEKKPIQTKSQKSWVGPEIYENQDDGWGLSRQSWLTGLVLK